MLIYVLAAIGIHRIWIYEDIFAGIRTKMRRRSWLKFLWCPPCFAFWASLLALPALWFPYYCAPLAAYACVRFVIMWYPVTNSDQVIEEPDKNQIPFSGKTLSLDDAPPPAETTLIEQAAIPAPHCESCQEKAKKREQEKTNQIIVSKDTPRLIVMTALNDFDSSYSLVTVIMDQCRAALRAGYYVELWGMHGMHIINLPEDLVLALTEKKNFNCRGVLPHVGWQEDAINLADQETIYTAICNMLKAAGVTDDCPATIITHDFIFQSWYINIAAVIHRIADEGLYSSSTWYHQMHSSVGERPPATVARWRAAVPKGHKMAAINYSDIPFLSKYYQASPDHFITLPNTRNIQSFMQMPPIAREIIDTCNILSRDIVQTYALSTPRMEAKGLYKVIDLFATLKKRGKDVFLIIVNAHADGEDAVAQLKKLKEHAQGCGMADNMALSSELFQDKSGVGLGEADVRSLLLVSNLFCFPSASESCGLVMLEAALAGNLLVLNASLPVLADFIPHDYAIHVPWGSNRSAVQEVKIDHIADLVIDELHQNKMNTAKRRVLRDFSVSGLAERMQEVL